MSSHSLLQGIFLTQGSNQGFLHCRRILYHLSHQGKFLYSSIFCKMWFSHRHLNASVSSVAQLCLTFCDPMNRSTPGLPIHHQLPESTQTQVHWVGDATNHLILCRPLLLPPPIFPSIRVFSNESALHIRWQPKYWSFSLNISPSNEHPGLISFRMDWLDVLAVQGTLQESSPTSQFKSINSLVLSFLL